MPKIRIDIIEGKPESYKRQLLDIVHDALVPTTTAFKSCTSISLNLLKSLRAKQSVIPAA